MIHSISCKNFYSFGENTTMSFLVNENAPENNGYFSTLAGARLSKVEAVVGPNASGKTNLLKILPFLKWLIVDSFNQPPEAPLFIQPCMFDGYKDSPSDLSVVFEFNGDVYTYSFTLTRAKILSEELRVTGMAKEKKSSKRVFLRTLNEGSGLYDFEGENFNLPKGFENLLRANTSVISVAMRLNHKESQDIASYWQKVVTNVAEGGWAGDNPVVSRGMQLFEAFNFFHDNENLRKAAEKLLNRFDLGLDTFEIDKQINNDNSFTLNVKIAHLFNGKRVFLPGINYESSGTQQLLVVLKSILFALDQGSIAVLDEIDVNLHPEMVSALFDLFIEPTTNPHNAQLLFSTHSHLILSKLDKYQIVFTEKGEGGFSQSWRLDEVKGVRADDNYYAKYITGAYGAVPKIS